MQESGILSFRKSCRVRMMTDFSAFNFIQGQREREMKKSTPTQMLRFNAHNNSIA